MSRSYKKYPGGGLGSSKHQKQYKQAEHRAERSKIKSTLLVGKEILPHPKEYGNEWSSPRDGKQYWLKPKEKEQIVYYRGIKVLDLLESWVKWMRK